jgi:hypothetical protein
MNFSIAIYLNIVSAVFFLKFSDTSSLWYNMVYNKKMAHGAFLNELGGDRCRDRSQRIARSAQQKRTQDYSPNCIPV